MSLALEVNVTLAAEQPSEADDAPEKPVCANCRSSEITFDATAYWDAKQQQFEYDILDAKVFCVHCDGKQHVEWVAV